MTGPAAGRHHHFGFAAVVLVVIALAAGLSPARAQSNGDDLLVARERSEPVAPVVIDGRVLFRVRGVTAFPAEQRAQAIAGRIMATAADKSIPVTKLHLVPTEHTVDILAGDQRIMSVFNVDAAIEGLGMSRQVLAGVYLQRIARAISDYRAERLPAQVFRDIVMAGLATLAALIVLFVIIRGLRWITGWVERRYESAIEQIEEGSLRIISARSIWAAVHFTSRAVNIVAVLALLYIYLHFVLALFPWTRALAVNLRAVVFSPVLTFVGGLLGTIPNLVLIALIALATRYVLSVARFFFSALHEGKIRLARFDREWANPTYKIVRVLIIAFAVVICYPYIPGSD